MATQSCAPPKQEYDFSMFPFPGNVKVFPAFEIGIKVTLGVIVELVAIIGNILVITIVVRFKRMRTTTNFYLVNLAVSDILVVLIPVWVLVVDSLTEFWVFGSFLCKFNPFLQMTAMCSSMFTLMVIAGDRFFAIMYPMKSRVTRRKVSLVLVVVWIAAIAIASPLLFIYSHIERHWTDVHETYCDEIWPMKYRSDGTCDYGQASKKAYWIVVCGVLNWTPMICMMMAYTFIVVKLRKHKIVPKLGASAKSTIQQKSKRRVVFMLFSVFIMFIVCAVPFQGIKIYYLFTQGIQGYKSKSELLTTENFLPFTDEVTVVYHLFTKGIQGYKMPSWFSTLDFGAVLLLYSNAAINPIIYGGLNETFRRGFKDLINDIFKRNNNTVSELYDGSEFRRVYGKDSVLQNSTASTQLQGRRNSRSSIDRYRNGDEHNGANAANISTIHEASENTAL